MVRDPSFPDIYMDGMKDNNPYIFSPNACYAIFFYQTRETLFGDADIFKKFVENCIRRFRRSRFYTQSKFCIIMNHLMNRNGKHYYRNHIISMNPF